MESDEEESTFVKETEQIPLDKIRKCLQSAKGDAPKIVLLSTGSTHFNWDYLFYKALIPSIECMSQL